MFVLRSSTATAPDSSAIQKTLNISLNCGRTTSGGLIDPDNTAYLVVGKGSVGRIRIVVSRLIY